MSSRRYLCVHCDHRFESEDDKARCPKCMRAGGVERLNETAGASSKSRRTLYLAGAAVLLIVVGGYAWWASQAPATVSGEPPLRPLDDSELEGHLRNLKADAGELSGLLEPTDSVEALAEKAASGKSGSAAAESITGLIRKHASARAFVPWSTSMPRDTDLKVPGTVVHDVQKDGVEAHLYPLEVAALAVAALRSLDVPAMVAEVYGFEGDRRPPEPSGQLGYFAVALYEGEPGKGDPRIFDPYGGHATQPKKDNVRVLTDVEAIGAALGHRAMYALVHDADSQKALELAETALRLDRRSPNIRSARAAVLLGAGGTEEGLKELEAAARLRPDAPRRNNLAGVYLATQNFDRATKEVAGALEEFPDYAAAHATLGALHLGRGEPDQAKAALDKAQNLEPDLPNLPMLFANYYLANHEVERAVEMAGKGVRARSHDWQTRLQAAQVYRAAGHYREMREQARAVVEMVPPARRGMVEQLIGRILGPTALEAPIEDEASSDSELSLPGAGDVPSLKLGEGSKLLGGKADAPSLLGDDRPSLGGDDGDGPMLMLGDPSNLKLREPGSSLQLNIEE